MSRLFLICTVLVVIVSIVKGFKIIKNTRLPRVKPVNENFFLDIAEDPAKNTPKQIFGEVAYKSFVEEYDPKALIGGGSYDIIGRVRELKLLSATADSGLLEALENKGLTLSKVEKLLPLIDSYGLLPILVKNKDLVLALAPLLIEPAPLLIPLVVSLLKVPPIAFTIPGVVLVGGGIYESFDNSLLGVSSVLLGLPLVVLGTLLNGIDIPEPPPASAIPERVVASSNRPKAAKSSAQKVVAAAAAKAVPKVTTSKPVTTSPVKVSTPVKVVAPKVLSPKVVKTANSMNGKRATIKIK